MTIHQASKEMAMLCTDLSQKVPFPILVDHLGSGESKRSVPWFHLCLETAYLAMVERWIAGHPSPEVIEEFTQSLRANFFDMVRHCNFTLPVADAILDPVEKAHFAEHTTIPIEFFAEEILGAEALLRILLPIRIREYVGDLQQGIEEDLAGQRSSFGPMTYLYKRFNRHVYGLDCDPRSPDIDARFKFPSEYEDMLMVAFHTTLQRFNTIAPEITAFFPS